MKTLEKMSFSRRLQVIISFVFYIIFALFMAYQIVQAKTISIKIVLLLFSILILGVALYSEYLKHLFSEAIKTITIDLNPEQAMEKFNHLLKKDVFHAYKNDKKIFDTLYYMDQMQYNECLNHLQENYKFFHSSADQLLIYHYTNFYCSYMVGDSVTAQSEYKKLKRMRDTKVKGIRVSPLYNWEFIDGLYLMSRKDYKQSFNVLKSVNTQNMNLREKAQYYYHFAQLCSKTKDNNLKNHYVHEIKNIHGSSNVCLKGVRL